MEGAELGALRLSSRRNGGTRPRAGTEHTIQSLRRLSLWNSYRTYRELARPRIGRAGLACVRLVALLKKDEDDDCHQWC